MTAATTENGGQIGQMMAITDSEFTRIRELVYRRFGINLTEQKRSLVVGRLQKVLRQLGHTNFTEFLAYVEGDKTGQALDTLVNRISTNHTYFFRESDHFDLLSGRVLPELESAVKDRDLRVWCAACSTGEEAYGLVMTMMEYFGVQYARWDAGLLATDISARVLDVAREGIYPADRLQQVPAKMKHSYFSKRSGEHFQVKEHVRREVTFRRFNLINPSYPFRKPLHVIFCRNVMIYFDAPTRDALARRFFEHLVPGGYLFIGHSETLRRDFGLFEYIQPAVYKKPLIPQSKVA